MTTKKQAFAPIATDEVSRLPDHRLYGFLGLEPANPHELIGMVNDGLPYEAFETLRTTLQVSAKELSDLMRVSQRTLHRRREVGRFDSLESDRLLRISRVFMKSVALFENDQSSAIEWLHTSLVALGGATPFQYAATEAGALEVEDLIGRLEHGVFS